jgi:hypothetical protein
MKRLAILCAFVMITASCALRSGPAMELPQTGGATPWTHQAVLDPTDEFQFAIVSDRNGGMRPGVFADAVRKLNLLQPEFVMSVGDLIPGYTNDPKELNAEWEEIEGIIGRLDMRYFHTAGNHDVTNALGREAWAQRFGPTYYDFVYGDTLFLVLDSEEGGSPSISAEQADFVRRALAQHADVRWTFVFMHNPLWTTPDPAAVGWTAVEHLLAGRSYTVFAGHFHRYTKYVRDGHDYIVLATTGGDSKMTGARDGLFDEVVWVTMTPDGPSIVNLDISGIYDKDLLTDAADVLRGKFASAVALPPISAAPGAFTGETTQLRVTNAGAAPMEFTAAFRANRSLRADPEVFDFTVPPGTTAERAVTVRPAGAVQVGEAPPLQLAWTVSADLGGPEPVSISNTCSLGVDAPLDCPRRTAPVKVDGRLDDWPGLPLACTIPQEIQFDPDTWSGPDDASFRFATAYDDANLYIAIRATDDRNVFDQGQDVWRQDGLEVRLDARADPQRSLGTGEHEGDDFLVVAVSPVPDSSMALLYGPMNLPELPRVARSRMDGGYAAEIAVPASYLDMMQGKPWQAFRLSIAQDDFDYPGRPGAQIWWRPDWRRPLNYPGSGTFMRR